MSKLGQAWQKSLGRHNNWLQVTVKGHHAEDSTELIRTVQKRKKRKKQKVYISKKSISTGHQENFPNGTYYLIKKQKALGGAKCSFIGGIETDTEWPSIGDIKKLDSYSMRRLAVDGSQDPLQPLSSMVCHDEMKEKLSIKIQFTSYK